MKFREQQFHSENNNDALKWCLRSRESNNRATEYRGIGCKLIPKDPAERGREAETFKLWNLAWDLSAQRRDHYFVALKGSIWACRHPEYLGYHFDHTFQKGNGNYSERWGTCHKFEKTNLL